MPGSYHPAIPQRFWLLSRLANVGVMLVCGLALLGWILDLEWLKSVLPGTVAMNPGGTALSFLLCCVALGSAQANRGHERRWLPLLCGAVVCGTALLRLAMH